MTHSVSLTSLPQLSQSLPERMPVQHSCTNHTTYQTHRLPHIDFTHIPHITQNLYIPLTYIIEYHISHNIYNTPYTYKLNDIHHPFKYQRKLSSQAVPSDLSLSSFQVWIGHSAFYHRQPPRAFYFSFLHHGEQITDKARQVSPSHTGMLRPMSLVPCIKHHCL